MKDEDLSDVGEGERDGDVGEEGEEEQPSMGKGERSDGFDVMG